MLMFQNKNITKTKNMNFINFVLLDAAPAAGEGKSSMSMWIMLGLLMVVFYFFMIRPQTKKQKELNKFRESLSEGSNVVTVGGVHGKVNKIKENTVLIEVADKVVITVDKASIVQQPTATTAASKDKKK